MKLMDYTTDSGFLPQLKCGDVSEAVGRLVASLGDAITGPDALVEEIMRREQEGSTAIGGGLIIPHARSAAVSEVGVAIATLAQPLEAQAADGRPVDVVILLIGPTGDPRQMLRVLAKLARLVKNSTFLDDLRAAHTPEELQAAFGRLD